MIGAEFGATERMWPVAHSASLRSASSDGGAIAEKYDVTVPQLSIRYCLQLGLLPLPKTENPEHMTSNADVGFGISDDMETLKNVDLLEDYGEARTMPVFGGTLS